MKTNTFKVGCLLAALLGSATVSTTFAKNTNWRSEGIGRVAISSDGNKHDNDDMTASMVTMMILANAGLQNVTTVYTYSDHIWGSDSGDEAKMDATVLGACERFGFNTCNAIAAVKDPEKAYTAMAAEIAKSTAEDPLFIIPAGPMQVVGEALDRANKTNPEALNHVTIISHSTWNENHSDNYEKKEPHGPEDPHEGWNWSEMKKSFSSKVNFVDISDQNGTPDANGNCYTTKNKFSTKEWTDVAWMKNHADPNINWVYSRGKDVLKLKPDFSDAGMAFYLVTGNQDGNVRNVLSEWIGSEVIETNPDETKVWSIAVTPTDFTLENIGDTQEIKATLLPATALDKSVTWSSSNEKVATVSPAGVVTAVAKGAVVITATANDGGKTATVNVTVGVAEAGEVTVGHDFIAFEAEASKSDKGNWKVVKAGDDKWGEIVGESNSPAPSGGIYIEYMGGVVNGLGVTAGTDMLQYKFVPKTDGIYKLSGRMSQQKNQNGGTVNWDECNDIYIKMEGNFTSGGTTPMNVLTGWNKFYGKGGNIWGSFIQIDQNHTKYQAAYKLKAGEEYTFSISGRSKGVAIDYFLLSKSLSVSPSDAQDLATHNPERMRPGADTSYANETYKSASDFTLLAGDGGDFVKPTVDANRNVLQIANRLKWAAVETTYKGEDVNAYITLNTMLESDGESTFKVFVNDKQVGELTNPSIFGTSTADYTIHSERITPTKIALTTGDKIRVEFNSATNGKVPEGNTTATSRGRWQSLQIHTDEEPAVETEGGIFDPAVFSFESAGWTPSLTFTVIPSTESDTKRFGTKMLRHKPGDTTSGKENAKNILVNASTGALRDFEYDGAVKNYRVKMDVKIVEAGAQLEFIFKHPDATGKLMTVATSGNIVNATDAAGDWKTIDLPITQIYGVDTEKYEVSMIQIMTSTTKVGQAGEVLIDNIELYTGEGVSSSIEAATTAPQLFVATVGGVVVVESATAQQVNVYTLTGTLVASQMVKAGEVTTIAENLTAGIYIVNNQKVVVK